MHDSQAAHQNFLNREKKFACNIINWKMEQFVAVTNMVRSFLLRSPFSKFRYRSTHVFHLQFSESKSCWAVCLRMDAWSLAMDPKTPIHLVGATCMVGVLACVLSLYNSQRGEGCLTQHTIERWNVSFHLLCWLKKKERGANSNMWKGMHWICSCNSLHDLLEEAFRK